MPADEGKRKLDLFTQNEINKRSIRIMWKTKHNSDWIRLNSIFARNELNKMQTPTIVSTIWPRHC